MISCPKCRALNEDDSLHCTQCGAALTRSMLRDMLHPEENPPPLLTEEQRILEEIEREKVAPRREFLLDLAKRLKHSERLMIENMPEIKKYPALSTIANAFKIFGWIAIVVGVLMLITTVVAPALSLESPFVEDAGLAAAFNVIATIFRFGLAIASLATLFIGFLSIATGEIYSLFIDLQENADRHSILLTLLLNRIREKQKEEL